MGTPSQPERIARLLFGSVRRDVLTLLLGRPDERFYLREIIRAAGAGSGAVQRELKGLVEAGLLTREAHGNQVYFSANRGAPVFPELQAIVEMTTGAVDVLRASLAPLLGRIKVALIYGSVASGRAAADSDVDLLIVGEVSLEEAVPALRRAEERPGREVNPSIYRVREFRDKVKSGQAFMKRVVSGRKLFLVGDERELAKLAR